MTTEQLMAPQYIWKAKSKKDWETMNVELIEKNAPVLKNNEV